MSHEILKKADEFLANEVAPYANEMDQDEEVLRKALNGLCDNGFMSMRRPDEYGGPNLDELSFRHYQESVARYSGSLAFLQTQHQSAVRMIGKSENNFLKDAVLPHVHKQRLIGIGFSQLRRSGEPILKAEKVDSGYLLNGSVPWVTGHTFFGEFLIGAALPDGSAVFGVVPFVDTNDERGKITFKGPMKLAAMESPRTMSAEVENFLLTDELVAFIQPPGWIISNDMINVTLQSWFALGCARGGLDVMQASYEKKKADFILVAWKSLDEEVKECRESASNQELSLHERLKARAWAIDLAARCTHAAVASSSGAANSVHHNAQRVYREALVYTVSAQTKDIMEATLARLVSRGGLN